MAIVTFEKTYEFFVNHILDGSGQTEDDQSRDMIWHIKNQLISWTNYPWDVDQSCGYTGSWQVGYDDYWPDYSALLWNSTGNDHAWCVLNAPTGGQLLLDCNGSSTRTDLMTVKWSPEGLFGAGTTTTAPTAVDEHTCYNQGSSWKNTSSVLTFQLHMIHSTDGEIDHVMFTYNATPFLYWVRQTVEGRVDGYTLPVVFAGVISTNLANSAMTYSRHVEQTYWKGKKSASGDGTGIFTCGLTHPITRDAPGDECGQIVTSANDISEAYVLYSIGIASFGAGLTGRHGYIVDQWMVPSALVTGSTLEEDPLLPTYELAVFANMALPWNGTVPVVS
jgi:hypothetical protein